MTLLVGFIFIIIIMSLIMIGLGKLNVFTPVGKQAKSIGKLFIEESEEN